MLFILSGTLHVCFWLIAARINSIHHQKVYENILLKHFTEWSSLPRDRTLSITCQEQLSFEGTFLINDKISLRKFFEIFKKDQHHKKAHKILHLTFPPLHHRTLLKILLRLFKHRLSLEGSIVPGELSYWHNKFFTTSI